MEEVKKYCLTICDLALFQIESSWISNRIPIISCTFKSNLLLLKSNIHKWFNRDLNRIAIWICPSLGDSISDCTARDHMGTWRSCATLDPTRGSGRVGSDQKIYRKGRVWSGLVQPEAKRLVYLVCHCIYFVLHLSLQNVPAVYLVFPA